MRYMRTTAVAPLALSALVAAGCASEPPERAERERVLLRAIEPCGRQYPAVRATGLDDQGRLRMEVSQAGFGEVEGFKRCAQDAVKRAFDRSTLGTGQLAATAGPATVAIKAAGTGILMPALVDGTPATLLLDTGATFTLIRPALARRAGIRVPPDAPKFFAVFGDGRIRSIPSVRVQSLSVGAAAVEGVHVGVFEGLPDVPDFDGLLGGDFLNHFKVTIDRQNHRLTLEPSRANVAVAPAPRAEASAPPSAPAASGREWRPPVWRPGDEWRVRWQSPSGSGTYVRTVVGEETVDDLAHYVVKSGARRTYYVKATLGWHFEKVYDIVAVRRTPPPAYEWPLRVGKSWELRYRREDRDGRAQDFYRKCTALDETTLNVPAGAFLTIHVVCRDRAGRIVTQAWYAEEAKNWVRERFASNQGERIEELVSYSMNSPKASSGVR